MCFKEFDAITKRIAKLETAVTRDRYAVDHFASGRGKFGSPLLQIVNEVSDVRLRSGTINPVLCTKMYLGFTKLQPKATAPGERLRLWNFNQTKNVAVEGSRFVLRSFWNTYLSVMDRFDHFPFFSRMRRSTVGGISPSIRPPNSNTCFIRVDET